ncbi:hypothetical protein GQ600_18786 [Phytophthora cactorum]|nr:hypothetical protein GQ600_18786 [Phytophthora cactorum]
MAEAGMKPGRIRTAMLLHFCYNLVTYQYCKKVQNFVCYYRQTELEEATQQPVLQAPSARTHSLEARKSTRPLYLGGTWMRMDNKAHEDLQANPTAALKDWQANATLQQFQKCFNRVWPNERFYRW